MGVLPPQHGATSGDFRIESRCDSGQPALVDLREQCGHRARELVALSQKTYGTWGRGKNAANQDVSTLFFARVADLYLREGGSIGMVLPHSTLRSGQHLKWRSGSWVGSEYSVDVDFGVKTPWDLDNLDPNTFFPMPASVVFARLIGRNTEASNALAPGAVEVWRGRTATSEVTREVEPLIHDDGQFHSLYHEFARRGADIFDRRLYFITVRPNPVLMAMPNTFVTEPRISTQDKKQVRRSQFVRWAAARRQHIRCLHGREHRAVLRIAAAQGGAADRQAHHDHANDRRQ